MHGTRQYELTCLIVSYLAKIFKRSDKKTDKTDKALFLSVLSVSHPNIPKNYDAAKCTSSSSSFRQVRRIVVSRHKLVQLAIQRPCSMGVKCWNTWMLGATGSSTVFGNSYLEAPKNRLGKVQPLQPALAKYMRRGCDDLDTYFMVQGWKTEHAFAPGSVLHLREPDVHQEIYGVPEYLAALQSAWLNESARCFGASITSTVHTPATSCISPTRCQTRRRWMRSRRRSRTARGRGIFGTSSCMRRAARRMGFN